MEHALTDKDNQPIKDGNIPQDSSSQKFDSLATPKIENDFKSGNFKDIVALPITIQKKTQTLAKTFVPLIDVALIELLGASNLFVKEEALITPTIDNNTLKFAFSFTYSVSAYIGTDIPVEAIKHDADYVLNRIKPAGLKITKCEIDTEEGKLLIRGEC